MKNAYLVKGSIFFDCGLPEAEAHECEKKSNIMITVLRIVQSNVLKKSFILKSLGINKSFLKDIEDGEIIKLSLESLKAIEAPAQQLLELVQYIESKQKQTSTEQETELA